MFGQNVTPDNQAQDNQQATPPTSWQPTGAPSDDSTSFGGPTDNTQDSGFHTADVSLPDSTPQADQSTPATNGPSDDLLSIKQEALQQLSPLVGHLEQSPEEKFRTTMMMIQASDDQSLLKSAYDTAKQITDDKVRAQALLDIVNEINYFTQHNSHQS
jgi:hypothetical protein